MTIFGEITTVSKEPEIRVAILAVVGLIIYAVWRSIRQLSQAISTPDPWDDKISSEITKDDAIPLCNHCLTPHSNTANFCLKCGAPVGQYTNWLPLPQLFSIGYVLRAGTSGDFKRTPLTILGFMLFSLVEYTLFVPVYWIVFLRKLAGNQPTDTLSEQPPPDRTAPTP